MWHFGLNNYLTHFSLAPVFDMLYMIYAPLHVDIRNIEEVLFTSWLLSGLYLSLHTLNIKPCKEVNASLGCHWKE